MKNGVELTISKKKLITNVMLRIITTKSKQPLLLEHQKLPTIKDTIITIT